MLGVEKCSEENILKANRFEAKSEIQNLFEFFLSFLETRNNFGRYKTCRNPIKLAVNRREAATFVKVGVRLLFKVAHFVGIFTFD